MKNPTRKPPFAVILTVLLAALAAFVTTSQAQVTVQQLTNGLVDYYPLISTNLDGVTTPDYISRRDMTLFRMSGSNVVAGSHPGMEAGVPGAGNVFNLLQSGGATFIYYQTTGQNPLDGSGDFLPFINQRGATMNFWCKFDGTNSVGRGFSETDNGGGDNNPFFSVESTGGGIARWFLRGPSETLDPNGVATWLLDDGTFQLPAFGGIGAPGYMWQQPNEFSTSNVFNNSWHMVTLTIATNGDVHQFIDGAYDPGAAGTAPSGQANLDNEGNQSICPPIYVTNFYYTTNLYPPLGVTNPPPNGFVRWMVPKLNKTGCTVFGGFLRNGGAGAGMPGQLSDIGFWNRVLATNEIQFLATNGLNTNGVFALTLNTNAIIINSFTADFAEVAQNHTVTIRWTVIGANETPGGIVISGIGDVSATPSGSAVVTLGKNASYTFNMTAHNGVVADKHAAVTVQTFAGAPSQWNLIQRFDGIFANTTSGIGNDPATTGKGWINLSGIFGSKLDRFNVVTVNGNKALSPKSGYATDTAGPSFGYDTPGAIAYGFLNGLTIPPYATHTLFMRFSLRDPGSLATALNLYSGLDFALGLTDYAFAAGPIGGTQPPGGVGSLGPGFHITRSDASYQPSPFDLKAADWNGTNNSYNTGYDYITSVSASGLDTNANYMVWLDVSNDLTHAVINGGVTNTLNESVFSMWLQKQGDPSRTLLFSGFHGNRDYSQYGVNNDFPTPYLDKVFTSIGTENFANGDLGAFFETNNMLLVDDFYLSTNGYDGTIPRLFNLTSIVRGAGSATINWESLGSLFQTNTYSVQRTLSLKSPISWVTLTNGLPSGGDFTSFTDSTVGSANPAFYRVSWP